MNNILALEHSGQIYLINIKEAPIEIDDVANKEHYDLKNSVTLLHEKGLIDNTKRQNLENLIKQRFDTITKYYNYR
ncbi:hypothetical protein M3215_17395 [Bacillus cytotoxicus]|uniref:Uncharacterized protein n=1 Tax=Bacillus cytotoxicus TaxID=580165 RepID=A0ACC6AA54_9BACI|nr:hypothetical protein [Bacillus cytotoxicus]